MFRAWRRIILALILTASGLPALPSARAASIFSDDDVPGHAFDFRFSTNWYAAVHEALPARYSEKKDLTWQEATNGLSQASSRERLPAQALWGFALIVLKQSPESTASGLKLMVGAAEKGYTPAMLNFGYLFEITNYVAQDYNQARYWFSRAAALGSDEAQLQLGGCFHYGLGTNQDFSMAAKYYRMSAQQTNFVAMKCLGFLLMNGYGVATNLDEARFWFTRAAKEGNNRRAMFNLGALCTLKYPDPAAMKEAFQWMKQSAELGDALAAYELSNFYFRGWGGTETNLTRYRFWLAKAASLGATDAQFYLGLAYRNGDGVPKDVANSLLWYGKAAAKNHPEAVYDLALHYLDDKTNPASLQLAHELMLRAAQLGQREAQFQCALSYFRGDVTLDFEGGRKWLSKAAENGWPKAEFCLFQLYYNGLQPGKDCPAYPKDKIEAVKWLRRAAEQGLLQAQSVLAVMLIRGLDVEPDKKEAGTLLRYAAEHGFAQAQNDLGFAIFNGDVASTNVIEAAMWIKLAIAHSTDPNVTKRASVNLGHALAGLTADQQQEVNRSVKSFQPQPVPEMEPRIKDWEKNPDYQREDGQFGH